MLSINLNNWIHPLSLKKSLPLIVKLDMTTGRYQKDVLLAFVSWLIANVQFPVSLDDTCGKLDVIDFPSSVVVDLADALIDSGRFSALSIWIRMNK